MDNNFGTLVGVFLAFGSGSYDRELKQQLFWVKLINHKLALFSFNMVWRHQICMAKRLVFSIKETICSYVFWKLKLKSAKSPIPVNVGHSNSFSNTCIY